MKSLFSENRLANLLVILRRTRSATIETLTSILNVSDRTVRNDIKQINEEMHDCAVIDMYQGRYVLRIYREEVFRKKFSEMIQEEDLNSPRKRMCYIFGKLMRAQEPVLTDELAYEMNVGRTTMVSDLKKLRTEVEPYKLIIAGKTSKGLVLNGSEMDIRRYIMENYFDVLYRDYPIDKEIMEVLSRVMEKNFFEKKVRESVASFTILMLDRFLTGHYIGPLTDQYYNLTSRAEFEVIDQMINQFEEIIHIEIPVEERLYVFLPIIGMRTPTDAGDMQRIELDERVRPLMDEIVLKIKTDMDITIRSGEFTEEFLYHLMFMVNRLRFNVKLKNPLLEDLKNKYPLAYQMSEIAAKVIEEYCHKPVPEEEKGYLASYFSVFLTKQEISQPEDFSVAVVCGTGRVTARLVAVQLKKILDSATKLTIISDEKVNTEMLNTFDLILTTVRLSCSCDRPVITINEIFDERELLSKIEKARYWDEVDIPLMDNNWFVMTGLLDESRFFVFENVESYDEAVTAMVTSLVEDGQLDVGFEERLIERENKGTMVFDHSIAIPHSIQHVDDRLVLAIGVLKKPIQHHNHEIQLIFLLGLPDKVNEEERLLLRVYDELMTIATDDELKEKIVGATSFSELLRVLYRNGGYK